MKHPVVVQTSAYYRLDAPISLPVLPCSRHCRAGGPWFIGLLPRKGVLLLGWEPPCSSDCSRSGVPSGRKYGMLRRTALCIGLALADGVSPAVIKTRIFKLFCATARTSASLTIGCTWW